MIKHPSKAEIISSIAILFWIFIVNIGALVFTTLPAWPMFFVTIFFFTMGADVKNIPSIFLSGLAGIVFAWSLIKLLAVMAPIMGEFPATAILLFAVLAIIIVSGNFLPGVFNNIAFAYLTICAIDMSIVEERFLGWMAMHLVGGAIILGGALLISVLLAKMMAKPPQVIEQTVKVD